MICQIHSVTPTDDFLCGYLLGYQNAYGTAQPFLQFYGDDRGGQMAIMDGVATVVWHHDTEELRWFLSARADIYTIRCSCALAEALVSSGWKAVIRPVMRCESALLQTEETAVPPIRELYPFLASVFADMPPFDQWYVDVSHRVRHGCCRIFAVENGDAVVASAMTVAQWKNGAVIGAVATHPDFRRRGLAARCVTNLTAELQKEGKTVYICPKNDGAQRLYERLGFVSCDMVALLERN